MPTRFKYTKSAPQSFGLTAAEILVANDKDLNQYMGIKKYAPYRRGGNWDRLRPERLKEFREKLKTKVTGEGGEVQVKRRKGKKERQKAKAAAAGDTSIIQEPGELQVVGEEKKRKREEQPVTMQTEAEEGSPKKRKRRHKKSLRADPTE